MATTEGVGVWVGVVEHPRKCVAGIREWIGRWDWCRQKETDGFDLNLMKSVFVASWRLLVCQPFAASSHRL